MSLTVGSGDRALLAQACIQFKATMEVGCQTAAFGPSGTDSVPGFYLISGWSEGALHYAATQDDLSSSTEFYDAKTDAWVPGPSIPHGVRGG